MANTLELGNGKWATGKDTVLAFNDENNNFKPLPFSFSRNSSATVVNEEGLIETVGSGEPRIDFKDNTKGALLLEPSRSNLVAYSEDFSNSYWNKNNSTVVSGFVSPSADSPLGAFKLVATTNDPYIYKNGFNVTANTQTASIYVKGVGSSIGKEGRILFWYIGTAGGTTLSVPFTLTSDWQRVQGSSTPTSGGTIALRIDLPDVSVVGEEVLIYGAQLEEGSYATSYIPTSGSAVTRIADVCNNGGNEQVINSTEGVLYAEVSTFADNTYKRISINNGSYVNSIVFDFIDDNNLYGKVFVGGSPIATILASGLNIENNNKLAFKYKQNDFALWVNGIQVGVDTSGSTPSGLNTLGLDLAGNQDFYGNTKDIRVYNTALTDAELQALTTI
jgi:hypothetical protein